MILLYVLIVSGLSALFAAAAAWLLAQRRPGTSNVRLAALSSMVPGAIMMVLAVIMVARVTSGDCPAEELGCDMAALAEFAIAIVGVFATMLSVAIGFLAAYFTIGALRRQ